MTDRLKVPAVTVEQMKEVDRLMIEEYGILLIQMMENAGRAVSSAGTGRRLNIRRYKPCPPVVDNEWLGDGQKRTLIDQGAG